MQLNTGGVLVLASSNALKDRYETGAFNYSFPEGLQGLLDDQAVIALTTYESEDLVIEVRVQEDFPDGDFDRFITQFLVLGGDDELLVLSHHDFTMICDQAGGDYSKHRSPIESFSGLQPGVHRVNLSITNIVDPEDDEFLDHFKVIVSLMSVPESRWKNEVLDFSA